MNEPLDNSMPTHPDHLYTWVDVNNYFAELARRGRWPIWLREVDGYWDSVRFSIDSSIGAPDAWGWLHSVLGPLTIDQERQLLLLDDAGEERPLAIEFVSASDVPSPDRQPRWTSRRIVADLALPLPAPRPTTPHDLPIVAFHSFKGGVGRTLHCVAAARRLADAGKRVLLIDADLEAPGISWMVSDSTRTDFAYEDFLALVHGAADQSYSEAISLGRKFLANQELDGVVIMPARRDGHRITPTQIEPVDLMTTDRDPYVLTEALAELGHALDVNVIVVDMRAGASELSAPLLLDPRVMRVFVTTISDQSVRGTAQILRELARRAPARQQTDPDCGLVVTQFNPLDHDGRLAAVASELRNEALAVSGRTEAEGDQVDADVAIPIISSRFDPNLLNLPGNWPEVVRLTARSGLTDLMGELVDTLPRTADTTPDNRPTSTGMSPDSIRARLAEVAGSLVYAEESGHHDFLSTAALRSLAQAHRTELPVEVVIGSKGAGKTFTYLQICTRPTWASFVQAAGVSASPLTAPTVAVLASTTLKRDVAETIDQYRIAAAQQLTGRAPAPFLAIRELVGEALLQQRSPRQWRQLWLACFGLSVGLDVTEETAETALADFASHHSAVFVLDGLENVFRNFVHDGQEQLALRALLVDCPEWLRTLRGRPLGLVAFVRRDLVRAIGHNVGQFERRYEKYALRWNQEEALRLTAWVCQRSGALHLPDEEVRTASREVLSQRMTGVWGEKMGTSKSREARSEVWFFAALSDFNQQIQARDIVSFLATAAESSIGGGDRWADRILTPLAMRNALPKCSQQKIEAISEENEPVAKLLRRLRALEPEHRSLPFQLDAIGLSAQDAELLEANGVVLAEDGQYWIPEIFRHGLNFTMRSGRRPRVLAVAHLVRRRNDVVG